MLVLYMELDATHLFQDTSEYHLCIKSPQIRNTVFINFLPYDEAAAST